MISRGSVRHERVELGGCGCDGVEVPCRDRQLADGPWGKSIRGASRTTTTTTNSSPASTPPRTQNPPPTQYAIHTSGRATPTPDVCHSAIQLLRLSLHHSPTWLAMAPEAPMQKVVMPSSTEASFFPARRPVTNHAARVVILLC